jgi:hypothetical protein
MKISRGKTSALKNIMRIIIYQFSFAGGEIKKGSQTRETKNII